MVVADPGHAQGRILWPGAHAHMTGTAGDIHQSLQQGGDIRPGETEILVPALLLHDQHAGRFQFRKMAAGGLGGDAGLLCQFAGRQGAAVHQGGQHVGAGRIAEQGGDRRNGGTFFHRLSFRVVLILRP